MGRWPGIRMPVVVLAVLLLAACGGGDRPEAGCSGDCEPAPVCGDGICAPSESSETCETDCPPVAQERCGDLVCNGDENPVSCPGDCPCSCDAGLACDAAASCVCTNDADGICPAQCTEDPDCVTTCTPDCDGRSCGSDGCGGTCGTCGADQACVDAQCVALDPRCGNLDPSVCASLSWGSCAADWIWRSPFTEVGSSLLALEGDENRVWLAGDEGFIGYHDGTDLFRVATPAGTSWISDLWRSPAGRYWAAGSDGRLFLGDGECWAAVPTPTRANLNAVWGSSDEDVWAVGGTDVVLHFDGKAWRKATIASSLLSGGDLRDVWGAGEDVWVVGGSSLVLHYDGRAWDRYQPVYEHHDFHRVFARSASDVFVLAASGWWTHFNGTEWETFARPELLLDIWSDGDAIWRSWAFSGDQTGGFEWSQDGGATFTPVGGIYELIYSPRITLGALWGLRPTSRGTDLVRVVEGLSTPIGDDELVRMRYITAALRAGDTWLATDYDHLYTHDASGWQSEPLPEELQGRYFAFGATLGDDVWISNSWRPEGPTLAHRRGGVWSRVSLSGLVYEAYGLACTSSACFIAGGTDGVLRLADGAWIADASDPAGGAVLGVAAVGDDAWLGVNNNGVGSIYVREADVWTSVATGLGPFTKMASGDGRAWALTTGGRIHAIDGAGVSTFGDLPSSFGRWIDLRVDEGRLHAITASAVCSSPTDHADFHCEPAPLALPFFRLVRGPERMWVLSGDAGFVELR